MTDQVLDHPAHRPHAHDLVHPVGPPVFEIRSKAGGYQPRMVKHVSSGAPWEFDLGQPVRTRGEADARIRREQARAATR